MELTFTLISAYSCIVVHLFYVCQVKAEGSTGLQKESHSHDEDVVHRLQNFLGLKDVFYTVNIRGNGPAVLDSIVRFEANLSLIGKDIDNKTLFIYQWENNANNHVFTSQSNFSSRVKVKDFSSLQIPPVEAGKYYMKVKVYEKKFLGIPVKVAEGKTEFKLTETLNGKLTTNQKNRTRHIHPKTFATKKDINFKSVLTDVFDSNFTYMYIWYVDGIFQEWNVNSSSFVYNSNQTGRVNVTLKVEAVSTYLKKNRTFTEEITLKDEINITSIQGQKEVKQGQPIKLDVYYNGSNPSNASWEILNVNDSSDGIAINDKQSSNFSINIPANLTEGTYYLIILMENDVSKTYTQTSFSIVHRPVFPTSTVVAVPVVVILVGVIITLSALTYSALRFRQKEHVTETADFNFHPSIKSRPKVTTIIKTLINQFLERGQYSSGHSSDQHSLRDSHERTGRPLLNDEMSTERVKTYGTIVESADDNEATVI